MTKFDPTNPFIKGNGSNLPPTVRGQLSAYPFWLVLCINIFISWLITTIFCLSEIFAGLILIILLPKIISKIINANSNDINKTSRNRIRIQTIILVLTAMMTVFMSWKHLTQKKENINIVIVAIEKYKLAENHYPETLDQLVPKYLSTIPEAQFGEFSYSSERYIDSKGNKKGPRVFYVDGLFNRRIYDFNSKSFSDRRVD
jgi:hypothetical protein